MTATSKPALKKRKKGFTYLILTSLFLSFLVLYGLGAFFWLVYGYEVALSFFINLLKANQVGLRGLGETALSPLLMSHYFQTMRDYMFDAGLNEKAYALTQTGVNGLKDGLSGFFSSDLVADMFETGAGFLKSAYEFVLKAAFLFIIELKIFLIKAFLLIAAMPLFALLGMVGLIDGLSHREIRRAELGRESSYLFHMLNKWIAKIIGLGLCLWVCLPMVASPQLFFVPLGCLFAVMFSLSAAKFKKYL